MKIVRQGILRMPATVLCGLSANAHAGDITLDFVGTITFAGQVVGTTPAGYDLADYGVGDPVVGHVTFDNSPTAWGTIILDKAPVQSY